MTNSDKELSHREVNQTFKKKRKFLCECAHRPKCGTKFCSFSSRVNESIHRKKGTSSFFSRERFHRFMASSETSRQQTQTVAAFSEPGLKCHRDTPARSLHWNHPADSHRLGQFGHCRGQVKGMALSRSVPKSAVPPQSCRRAKGKVWLLFGCCSLPIHVRMTTRKILTL